MRSSSRWIRPVSECAVAHTCALAAPAAPAPHAAGAPPCPQTAHRAGGAEAVAHTCSHAHDPHMAGRPRERRISAPHSARRGDLVAAGAGRISHLGTLCTGGAEDSRTRSVSCMYGAWSGVGGRMRSASWRRGGWGGCRGIAGARGKIVAAEPWYMVREGVYIGVGGHRPVFGSRCGSPGVGRRSAKRRCE